MNTKQFLLSIILSTPLFLFSQITQGIGGTPGASAGDLGELSSSPSYDVFPPTPGAASLGKYGDYPVSLATGLVGITIPLFDISTGRIKLPITLSYHASGIRVDDIASNVGLGWILNIGGCISVTVRDRRDNFEGNINFASSSYIESLGSELSKLMELANLETFYNGANDRQSDLYTYSFNGYHGKFCYNIRGEIVQLKKDGLKIKGLSNASGYEIITPDGIQYIFEDEEFSDEIKDASPIMRPHETRLSVTYYLSKIVDLMTNDSIIFNYDHKEILPANIDDYYKTCINYPVFNGWETIDGPEDFANGAKAHPEKTAHYYTLQTSPVILEEIIFRGGKVIISNDKNRSDNQLYRVSGIKLYNNQEPTKTLKTVMFNHSSFSGGNRLRLDGLTIDGDKKYSFGYNENFHLPAFFSTDSKEAFNQDEWGYYNNGGSTLFQYEEVSEQNFPWHSRTENRKPHADKMKTYSLNKIIYPTGGKTEFELEANRIGEDFIAGGLRVKTIRNYTDKNNITPIKTISYTYNVGKLPPLYGREWYYEQQVITSCPEDRDMSGGILRYFSTAPFIPNRFSNGAVVYYETVTETVSDNNTPLQRNIYTHDMADIHQNRYMYPGALSHNTYSTYPYEQSSDLVQLLKQEQQIYDVNTNTFRRHREINYKYQTYGLSYDVIGMMVLPVRKYMGSFCMDQLGGSQFDAYSRVSDFYTYFDFIAKSGIKKLIEAKTTDYFADGSRHNSSIIKYGYYDYNGDYFLTKKTEINSNNTNVVTEITYPFNYAKSGSNNVYKNMRDRNMWFPIEQITKVGDVVTDASVTEYSQTGSIIYPFRLYSLETNNPVADYVKLTVSGNTHNFDSRHINTKQYSYYPNGNLKEVYNLETGMRTIILWSYNHLYPIAEIVGMINITEVENVVKRVFSVSSLDDLSGRNIPPNEAALKDGTLQNALPDLLVTTYIYKPLVGVTSKTDAHGETVYYTYDSVGRLSVIKDKDRKNIKSYIYKYKQQ
jgi:YD repeat-containing protein